MHVSDDVHLYSVKVRNAFYDKKSHEESTNITKAKYKLLTSKIPELEVYLFHILTTTEGSYIKERTIKILKTDWDSIEKGFLNAEHSNLDCQKIDVLSKSDILVKKKDSDNGFPLAGTVKQSKLNEIISLIKETNASVSSKTDFKAREYLQGMFETGTLSDSLLNDLGL